MKIFHFKTSKLGIVRNKQCIFKESQRINKKITTGLNSQEYNSWNLQLQNKYLRFPCSVSKIVPYIAPDGSRFVVELCQHLSRSSSAVLSGVNLKIWVTSLISFRRSRSLNLRLISWKHIITICLCSLGGSFATAHVFRLVCSNFGSSESIFVHFTRYKSHFGWLNRCF